MQEYMKDELLGENLRNRYPIMLASLHRQTFSLFEEFEVIFQVCLTYLINSIPRRTNNVIHIQGAQYKLLTFSLCFVPNTTNEKVHTSMSNVNFDFGLQRKNLCKHGSYVPIQKCVHPRLNRKQSGFQFSNPSIALIHLIPDDAVGMERRIRPCVRS